MFFSVSSPTNLESVFVFVFHYGGPMDKGPVRMQKAICLPASEEPEVQQPRWAVGPSNFLLRLEEKFKLAPPTSVNYLD